MVEPTFAWKLNSGTEVTPSWQTIGTGTIRWTGPDGIGDPLPAPASGANWFDNVTSPHNGEAWLDGITDYQIAVAGRNTNQHVLMISETGGNPTTTPPELTAYDDATDAAGRIAPTNWPMIGTLASGNISCLRAVETTTVAPGAGWTGQTYDVEPTEGSSLDGETNKLTCAAVYVGLDDKEFNLATNVPNDVSVEGLITFVMSLQYTFT